MKLAPVDIPARPKGMRIEAFAVVDPRFEVRADAAVIEVFDGIGEGGVTPAKISAALRQIGSRPVMVQINSPGGIAHDGLSIFNILRGHAQPVTTQVLGIAASAAAIVAMAGDDVQMARASQLMIHRASGGAIGTADTMRQVADALDKVDAVMGDLFTRRTGLPRQTVDAMLRDETFINAEDAVALGFADNLLAQDALAAPRMAASATTRPRAREDRPANTRELEHRLLAAGLPRRMATREAGRLFAELSGPAGAESSQLDLNAVAEAIAQNLAALRPRRIR